MRSRLTVHQRNEITRRYQEGERPTDLGREFEVCQPTIQNIRRASGLPARQADRELAFSNLDLLVNSYRDRYPDDERKDWIEARIREWWERRQNG